MSVLIRLAVVLLAVGLAACGGSAPTPPREGATAAGAQSSSSGNPYLAPTGEPLTPIKVAACAVTGGFVHLYSAFEGDLFRKYGLQAELVTMRGSAAGLAALSTNEIQFLYCAAESTMGGLASGVEAKIVGTPLVGLPFVFVARPEVRTMADLRGRAVGVPRAGDLADKLSRLALERHGLRANEDVEIRPIGGSQSERYQAMLANMVQGVAVPPPFDAQGRKDGMHVLYDLADLGLPFVYSAVHASNAAIQNNPRLVQRFVAAIAEAVHFTEKNPAIASQAMRRVLEIEDTDILDSAYQAYARKLVNRDLHVPFDAVDASIEDARTAGTTVTVRGAQDVATNVFVDDLARSGFLEALWGAELASAGGAAGTSGR